MMARACLFVLAVVAGLYGFAPIADGDLFWNLNVGGWMLDHGALLPAVDPFTYNAQGAGTPHEWLLQLLFAAVERVGGLIGLRVLGAATCAAAVVLAFAAMRSAGLSDSLAVVATACWWIVVEPHAVLRPHLVAWLFALAVLGVWFGRESSAAGAQRTASESRGDVGRDAVALFVVCVIWANAHASVLVVPLYAGLFAVSLALRSRFFGQKALGLRRWIVRTFAAGIACLCQPTGVGLIGYAWSTPAINRELSFEWWPLLRADVWRSRPVVLVIWAALVLSALVVVVRQLRARRRDDHAVADDRFPDPLAAGLALVHAGLTRRMTAFLFLPLMYVGRTSRRARWHGGLAVAAVTLVLALHGRGAAGSLTTRSLSAGAWPVWSTFVMRHAGLRGRLFNPDGWGGYIAWANPGTKVFADGRWPLVGRDVIHDGFAMMLRRGDAEPLFDRYSIDVALLRIDEYLRVPPPDPRRWVLAYQGPRAVVLLRRGPAFGANVRAMCRVYTGPDALPSRHARWASKLASPTGAASPTDVPSVLQECAKTPKIRRNPKIRPPQD